MPVTDYIPAKILAAEGFIHITDTDAVMNAAFGSVPDIIDRRLDVPDIAKWLQVTIPRLRRYIADNKRVGMAILDKDDRLSIRQMTRMDWSQLKNQKRTPKLYGSNFQGRKRKTKTT
jgi:hypothetical protein